MVAEMDSKVYQEKLINNIIVSIEKHSGKEILSSVILTGSFGREEPTFINDDGELILKSDVEIALVYPKGISKNKVIKLIEAVGSEFTEDLNLMPISQKRVEKAYNFNFSFSSPKYKTIFTYDLFNGSKTIWGTDFIRRVNVSLDDIDPYEAKRLVGNRIGELVYLQSREKDNDYLRKQWKGKVLLAIGSAWLILNKKYHSSYYSQYNEIINDIVKIEREIGNTFGSDYMSVFEFLRNNGEEYEVPDDVLKDYVKGINELFVVHRLQSPRVNCFSRNLKYFIKYLKVKAPFGFVEFENNIIDNLIVYYLSSMEKTRFVADIWHKVLY